MILFQKKLGETPIQALDRLRLENPKLKYEKLSYAGRLDPLAEGELLVLVGEECKNREKYLGLDKVYEVEILFGFKTDTGDVLGIIEDYKVENLENKKEEISKIILNIKGEHNWSYPIFSSKPYKGKPLFQYGRNDWNNIENGKSDNNGLKKSESIGNLDMDELPKQKAIIYDIEVKNFSTYSIKEIQIIVKEKINSVQGDFRQVEILKRWDKVFSDIVDERFLSVTIKTKVGSGTYMRTLAEEVGRFINMPTLAFRIVRDRVIIPF